jgi:hypothetical protein
MCVKDAKTDHNWQVETPELNALKSLLQKYFLNFHKEFNVSQDTVVLYLREHKGSVAPN